MSSFSFLLVDDEKEFVEALANRLQQRGFIAESAFSGTEALDLLKKNGFIDIVILDVGMPYPNGIQTLEILKKQFPLVEVIMLTGEATVHTAVAAIKHGAFDYLMKPCDLNELLVKAEKAFLRKKDRQAQILDARSKPYITEEKRAELIARILAG